MRCNVCGETIALAKRCPYCGHEPRRDETRSDGESKDGSKDESKGTGTRGAFRGRIDQEDAEWHQRSSGKVTPSLTNVIRFLTSLDIPFASKLVVFFALFYILSPIDFIPGAALPVIGWFDDLAVMYMAWKWIESQLSRQ